MAEYLTLTYRPPIYVSTGAVASGRPLPIILDQLQAWGVERIEMGSGIPYSVDNVEIAKIQARKTPVLIHNYFPAPADPFVLNLAATDDHILCRSIKHCLDCLELTAAINAPFYAAHAGYTLLPDARDLGKTFSKGPSVSRAKAIERMRSSVLIILEHARKLGVSFLIENNVVAPFNAPNGINDKLLLGSPDEMLEFANEIGHGDFGYLIDTGHLKVSAHALGFDLEQAMESLLPVTKAFHLNDNDGSHDSNQPFGHEAWFLPYLSRVSTYAVVIEAYNLSAATLRLCQEVVAAALEQ